MKKEDFSEEREWDEEADEIQESVDCLEDKFQSVQQLAEEELRSQQRFYNHNNQ